MILKRVGRSPLFRNPQSAIRNSLCLVRAPALVALTSVVLLSGCQTGPRLPDSMRSMWVTRFDYKSAEDVRRIVDNCADSGINTILFQVRGNGTMFCKSSLEPWADELGGRDPGFDPLAEACKAAKQRGVQLHAWVNVMPAWRGKNAPQNPEQLYNKHPDWFWYDQKGERQPLTSFYVSLNPCLPEVRAYLVEVFRDLVRRYPVDGLHMDYIRFPNEPPAIPSGSGIDYPRDAKTLALYKAETGLAPDDDPAKWKAWRTEQVSRLVADIHAMVRKTRPAAALTASVGSVRENGLSHFQDARQWLTEGNIDAVFLMNYTAELDKFVTRNKPWLDAKYRQPVVPGLWFDSKRPVEENASVVRQQIEAAMESAGHFCIFTYSSLFDSRDEVLAKQDNTGARNREIRRRAVLPMLRSLAAR